MTKKGPIWGLSVSDCRAWGFTGFTAVLGLRDVGLFRVQQGFLNIFEARASQAYSKPISTPNPKENRKPKPSRFPTTPSMSGPGLNALGKGKCVAFGSDLATAAGIEVGLQGLSVGFTFQG